VNTVISVRTDKKIKNEAAKVAKSAGISLSALINSYLRQIVATRRIEIYAPEPMTPKLEGLIAKVEAELAEGKVSKEFSNAEEFLADLKK
jgi:addiction module RelB/DinJ family antitoxin